MSKPKERHLAAARKGKNDEFYTLYGTVEDEIEAYLGIAPSLFRDKTIHLPCDDYEESNFTKYFTDNFERLGIDLLISTSHSPGGKGKIQLRGKHQVVNRLLDGDGDFRSDEIAFYAREADFVITNPPFSLFRDFADWVMGLGVQFSIIGTLNALTYRQTFPYMQAQNMWIGAGGALPLTPFAVPKTYDVVEKQAAIVRKLGYEEDDNHKYLALGNICWYTNIKPGTDKPLLELKPMSEHPKEPYQPYDNLDAINVNKVKAIPSDYGGVMGVPVTFMTKYNPEQFEIVGHRYGDDGKDVRINGKTPYARIFIKHRR